MLIIRFTRAALAAALCSTIAAAQNQAPVNPPSTLNPQTNLPYGAPSAAPVSKWTPAASVGRQLTLNDLLTWKNIGSPQLSNDGKWFAYILAPNEGDAEVVVRGTEAGAKETRFPIGDASAGGGGRGGAPGGAGGGTGPIAISGNNRWLAFTVYPSAAANAGGGRGGRGGRGGGGGGGAAPPAAPKLAVVDLASGTKREFESTRAFRFAGDKSNWLAIHHAVPVAAGGANANAAAQTAGRGGAAPGGNATQASVLELVELGGPTTNQIQIANVSEFAFNDAGQWVAYAVSATDQVGNSLQLRELASGVTRSIDAQKASYRRLTWADSSNALAALRVVTDTAADEQATVVAWTDATAPTARVAEINARTSGVGGALVVSSDRALQWGDGQKTLYFGLREPRPPRDQTTAGTTPVATPNAPAPGAGAGGQIAAAPQTNAEVPSLILWHWKDPRMQSQQQVQEATDRAFNYLAVYHVASQNVTRLADDKVRDVAIGPKDTWGIGSDATEYERMQGIQGFAYRDIYAVNVATGERKLVQKKVAGGGGADASLTEPIEASVLIATVGALLRARRAEEALRDALAGEQSARETAESANRMKDEFLATLSHELRSPLGAILTWVTMLRSGTVNPKQQMQGLAAIERNTRLQVKLIEDLLDVSRIVSGKMRLDIGLVEPGAVIEAALESIRPAADAKGVRLEADIRPTLGPIAGDANRLQQVIWNLVSNAVKFTPRGGRVQVLADDVESRARIRVVDTGRGIESAFLPHVYERFRQGDSSLTRSEGGLGLGLAIVRHLVELHGGTVEAASDGLGQGSVFTVHLPFAAVQADGRLMRPRNAAPRPPAVPLPALAGVHVLVLDDSQDAREAVRAVLEQCGAQVTAVSSVPDALDIVAFGGADVVVSDISMPDQDGFRFIEEVRRLPPEHGGRVPAFALTAHAGADEQRRILAAGFDAYLAKPIEASELAGTVARLLRPAPS